MGVELGKDFFEYLKCNGAVKAVIDLVAGELVRDILWGRGAGVDYSQGSTDLKSCINLSLPDSVMNPQIRCDFVQ